MNLSDAITAAILSEKLGIAHATAKAVLEEAGEGVTFGRTTFYNRDAVRDVLKERHGKLLVFLGYEGVQSPSEAAVEVDNV